MILSRKKSSRSSGTRLAILETVLGHFPNFFPNFFANFQFRTSFPDFLQSSCNLFAHA